MRTYVALFILVLMLPSCYCFFISTSSFSSSPSLPAPHVREKVSQCVPKGNRTTLAVVATTCPCFVRYKAIDSQPSSVILSFLVAERSKYEVWQASAPSTDLPYIKPVSFKEVRPVQYLRKLQAYGWDSQPLQLSRAGEFVLVIQATSKVLDCSIRIQYDFRGRPRQCPKRLPPASRPMQWPFPFNLPHVPPLPPIVTRVSQYIVGGSQVIDNDAARFNVLLDTKLGKCTGSVISDVWVLSAAHCGIAKGTIAFVGGTTVRNGDRYTVVEAARHPDYREENKSPIVSRLVNDVALARLDRKIEGAKPIKLNKNKKGPNPQTIVRATGYGQLATRWPSDVLNEVDVPILGLNECRQRFRNASRASMARGIDNEAHICAGRDSKCGGGVCFGDSGGPLFMRHSDGSFVQVGITSYGDEQCANPQTPDVYARVATYEEWIQGVTGGIANFVSVKGNDRGSASTGSSTSRGLSNTAANALIGVGAGLGAVVAVLSLLALARAVRRARTTERPNPEIDNLEGVLVSDPNRRANNRADTAENDTSRAHLPSVFIMPPERAATQTESGAQ